MATKRKSNLFPLPVHSYEHYAKVIGGERLVNCYVEQAPPEGKAAYAVLRTHGIATGVTPGVGPGRGLYRWQGVLYVVSGATLYSINSSLVATSIGTVNGSDIVSFAETPTQLVICSAYATYTYDGTTLAVIADADFVDGVQCCSIDGYVLFRRANSGIFFSSDLADARSYDALFFATAEGLSDNIVGIIADHRQAILAGEYSMELWSNGGGAGFTFIRDPNGFLEIGCAAGGSLARIDNSVCWLASDLTIRRLDGLTPTRISDHGVEQAIASYATISDAQAFGYTQNGHLFYVLNFPTEGHTWVYDATTQYWHERESYGLTRWRPCSTAFAYGRWHVQDFETGKVGYLDQDTYTDWDDTQRMLMTFSSVYRNGSRLSHRTLEIMAEKGVGTVTGQGVDPQITLEVSDDSGKTWRTMATKSLGPMGEYLTRVTWDRLGSAVDRIYRLSISDPVRVAISNATLELA